MRSQVYVVALMAAVALLLLASSSRVAADFCGGQTGYNATYCFS